MKILIENKEIDVIDTAVYTINENDDPIGMRQAGDLNTWNRKRVLKQAFLFHATVIAKTSWYRQNKYDEEYVRSEDFELWCRTFKTTIFYRISEPLFIYREGNVNIKNYTSSNRTHRKILHKYGATILSKKELLLEITKSHLKSSLYRLFALFNMQYILTSKRNTKLNNSQIEQIRCTIKKINEWE